MSLRCRVGLHHWRRKEATLRKGTFVSRCQRCPALRVKHKRRRIVTPLP